MLDFLKSSIALIIIVTPIIIILLRLLFKNSVFRYIGLIWIVTAILVSLGSEAKVLFEGYTRAMAIPINVVILSIGIYSASLIVRNPLKEMINDLAKLSKGNIDTEITEKYVKRKDELGVLANSINLLALNLNKMISSIKQNSLKQTNISNDLNSIATSLTSTTGNQAASIEEVSATMEEIAANINISSENSLKTEKITLKTIAAIEEGNRSTIKSIDAMKHVGEKIKIINDIAFQTNILALNAAVEASHAGDAGKGFAVVAGEVKVLAEKSNLAAQAIEDVSGNVMKITEIAGSQFEGIVKETDITAKLIKEIASSSIEQNINVQQINDSVQNLNKMIQTNTTEVDRIKSGAESLLNTVHEMNDLISYFTLRK